MSAPATVSVVIPCRNEARYIASCLDSIAASDFPKERLEVLVVDGMSEDGTRDVLKDYSARCPFVKVVDNPRRITPVAFNLGIQAARGDLIMIMSAHATYAPDAITKCVQYSGEYRADNVGGVWRVKPRSESFTDRAVVIALSHPFGVGGARYRTQMGPRPRWVDTAAYGCYRRKVFETVGLFNERLVRGQDMELNMRLRKAGGKTLLAPDVVVNYFARSDFLSFSRHNFRNGVWAVLPFLYSPVMPVAWRHLTPLAFVAALVVSALLAVVWPPAAVLLGLVAAPYALLSLVASAHVAVRARDPRFFLVMPFIFASLHVCYGLGSLWGLIKVCAQWPLRRRLTASAAR